MATRATIISLALLFFASCASHLKTGKFYQSQNKFSLAVEYYDAGLEKSPQDEELKDAFIIAEQTYQWRLRQKIDRLVEVKSYLQAIRHLVEFKERGLRMKALTLPGEDPISLEHEYSKLETQAIAQIQEDLDQRGNRPYVMTSDLRACKQLMALVTEDNLVSRRCSQILNKLKLLASIEIAPNSYREARHLAAAITSQIMMANPELLEIVSGQSPLKNARIQIHVSPPHINDTGWYVSKKDSYHTWVKKLDKYNRPITQTIVTKPSQAQINAAKKAGKKPPKSKTVKKQLWKQVQGTYIYYSSNRTLELSYRLTVTNLRTKTIPVEFEGIMTKKSTSSYYDFRGSPRARKRTTKPEGRRAAHPLTSVTQLSQAARQDIATTLSQKLLQHLD